MNEKKNIGQDASKTNIKPILNLTSFSKNIIVEINKIRANPLEYSKNLSNNIQFVNESELDYKGIVIKLSEKKKSFNNLIDFLKVQEQQSILTVKNGIVKCAEDIMKVLILHDGIENTEAFSTNCRFEKKMNKYGCAFGQLEELVDSGSFSPELVVFNLLLCDGDPSRQKRKIMFSDKMKHIGVTTEILPCEKHCTVINLAEHYFDVGEDIPNFLLKIYFPDNFRKMSKKKSKSTEKKVNFINSHDNSNSRKFLNSQERDLNYNINNHNNNNNNIVNPIMNRKSYGVIKLPQNNINKYIGDDDDEEDNIKSEEEEIEEEEIEEEETEVIENDLSPIVTNNNNDSSKKIIKIKEDSIITVQKVDINSSIKTNSFNEDIEEIQDDKILKIHCMEKLVTDEKTNLKKTLVKKSIFYKDGTNQSIVFSKKK